MLTRQDRLGMAQGTVTTETIALEKAERNIRKWQDRAGVARQLLRQAENVVRELKLPIEPPDGAVVQFVKRFRPDGPRYRYVAHRVGHGWHCTGSMGFNGTSWERLVTFAEMDNLERVEFSRLYTSNASEPF